MEKGNNTITKASTEKSESTRNAVSAKLSVRILIMK